MESTRTLKDKIFLVLKGVGMGAANKVPGVSGGWKLPIYLQIKYT